jgi:hypothetical protein
MPYNLIDRLIRGRIKDLAAEARKKRQPLTAAEPRSNKKASTKPRVQAGARKRTIQVGPDAELTAPSGGRRGPKGFRL